MEKYIQTDELQELIDWDAVMRFPRYAGGHDAHMKGLLKGAEVIAHWNEQDWQGQVATCVRLTSGKYEGYVAIYSDYYGSCSGCDAWEDASDAEIRKLCIDLANGAYIFKTLEDVKEFLAGSQKGHGRWSYNPVWAKELLYSIETGAIYTG